MKPTDFLDEFVAELRAQLEADDERWGDTWLKRPKKGQGDRVFGIIKEYYDDERLAKSLLGEDPLHVDSLPWLKITGNALIGWIRERYPEHFPEH